MPAIWIEIHQEDLMADWELAVNGEKGLFDVSPYFKYPIYSSLKNIEYFKKGSHVLGTVAWPNEEDFCPDTVYLESKKIS